MGMNRWVIEVVTGRFLYGGRYDPTPTDLATQIVVDLPGEALPDQARQRYDVAAETKVRDATAEELEADVALEAAARAAAEIGRAAIAATVLLAERRRLGRALTSLERAALLDEWKVIFQAL
jgi:hypothetical protein